MVVTIKELQHFFPEIVNYEVKPITEAGQNYCGSILKITVILKNEEKLYLIAKQPVNNEFINEFANIKHTFRNELIFYQHVLPTLNTFLEEENLPKLNFFPKFFGGRLNLTDNLAPNADAIILLEDLITSGFEHPNKYKRFNLEETKFILKKIAHFHSASLGLKLKDPKTFQEHFGPYFDEFYVRQIRTNEDLRSTPERVNLMTAAVEEDEKCKHKFNKLKEMIKRCGKNLKHPKNSKFYTDGPLATLIHSDIWFNNLLIKYEESKMDEVMFLDLQSYEHASIARDLLFFIFINANDEVLMGSFNELLVCYYQELIQNLKKIHCDFQLSFDMFKAEVKKIAVEQSYMDCAEALNAVYQRPGHDHHPSEFTSKMILEIELSETAKKRIWLMTRTYLQENWV